MPLDPNPYLAIDREYDQVRRRDRIIRHLFVLALILTAIILMLAMMLLVVTRAHGSPIQPFGKNMFFIADTEGRTI